MTDLKKKTEYEYHDNGAIKTEIIYSKNDTAKLFSYYRTGQLKQVSRMKNDKFHGQTICYYPNGDIVLKCFYRNGELNGYFIRYYKNGQIKEKIKYKNNHKEGGEFGYYSNGKIKFINHYKNNLKHGRCASYNQNGETTFGKLYILGIKTEKEIKKLIKIENKYSKKQEDNEVHCAYFSNPHYVCLFKLKYTSNVDNAPFVEMKLVDEKEAKIFAKKYQESGGYIHCDKEIFDKLYFLEEKEEIPKEIYRKVAEVFWFIKDLNNKRNKYAFDMIYKFFSKIAKM